MKKISIEIEGMSCEGCENRIKNVLSELEFIVSVEANYRTGVVIITIDNKIDEQIIKDKIENLDFVVKRISYE